MRILHVIESLDVGGAERVVIDLVNEQKKHGHDVNVVCLFERGILADELEDGNKDIFVCGKTPGFDVAAVIKLMKYFRYMQPDVVHTHNTPSNYYATLARTLGFVKCVQVNTRHGMGEPIKETRREYLYELSLWGTDWAVGVCDAARNNLWSQHPRFKDKIVTVYNGIVLKKFIDQNTNHIDLHEILNVDKSRKLVGIVARISYVKNHELLINAYNKIQGKFMDTDLVIIGDGELKPQLERQVIEFNIESRVHFMGDRRDVAALLPQLDIFVLCSIKEGYSISLLEACAAGLPLVATDVGGNNEIVRNGQNGYIVASEDDEQLSKAIESLLDNPEDRKRMGQESLQWVMKNGSIEAMFNNYMKLYISSG